jgi:hypothetical protein
VLYPELYQQFGKKDPRTKGRMAVANQKRMEREEQELAKDWFERPENLLKKYTREEDFQNYLNSTPEQQAATQQEMKEWWRRERYPTLGERWGDFTTDMSSAMSGSGVMESLTPEERARVQQAEEFNPYRAMGASMGRFWQPKRGTEETKTQALTREALLQQGLLTTWDDEGRMNVIKKAIPDATFNSVGEGDNKVWFATMPDGREFAINRPGWTETDSMLVGAELAAYMPAAKFASKGVGIGNQALRAMGGGAATDVGLQGMQYESGAGGKKYLSEFYDPRQTAIVGGTGLLGELGVHGLGKGYKILEKHVGNLLFPDLNDIPVFDVPKPKPEVPEPEPVWKSPTS